MADGYLFLLLRFCRVTVVALKHVLDLNVGSRNTFPWTIYFFWSFYVSGKTVKRKFCLYCKVQGMYRKLNAKTLMSVFDLTYSTMTLQVPRQWAGKIWPTRSSSQSLRLSGLLVALRMSSLRLCRHLNGLYMCSEVTCDSEMWVTLSNVWEVYFYHSPTNLTDVCCANCNAAQRDHPTVMAIFFGFPTSS